MRRIFFVALFRQFRVVWPILSGVLFAMVGPGSFGQKHGYETDIEQELLAFGAANVATGLGQGYPVAGGMSQTAVNDMGGATSPMALVVNSAMVVLVLIFFAGLFHDLPEPVLASVVLMAAWRLLQFEDIHTLRGISWEEYAVALVALLGVLLAGVLNGVLIAAATSLALMIGRLARPHVVALGYDPESGAFVNLANRATAQESAGVLVLRAEHPWLYFNVEHIRRRILELIAETPEPTRLVVLDFSPVTAIDPTSAAALASLVDALRGRGIELEVALLRDEVFQRLGLLGISPGGLVPHRSIAQCIASWADRTGWVPAIGQFPADQVSKSKSHR